MCTADGYTKNDVHCTLRGRCECHRGFKSDGIRCIHCKSIYDHSNNNNNNNNTTLYKATYHDIWSLLNMKYIGICALLTSFLMFNLIITDRCCSGLQLKIMMDPRLITVGLVRVQGTSASTAVYILIIVRAAPSVINDAVFVLLDTFKQLQEPSAPNVEVHTPKITPFIT